MTTATVDIELREKLERFKQAMLTTVPGITEESAEKAARAFEKNFYVKQAKELAGLTGKHKKTGDDIGKTWTELGKKIAEMAGGPFGDLGDAVFELVPKAGAAAAALGGIAAGAVGITAVGAAMYGLAEAAEAAEDRLTEAGLAAMIPEEAKASLDRYSEATTSLRREVDLLTVSLGAKPAEAISGWASAITGAAVEVRELDEESSLAAKGLSAVGSVLATFPAVRVFERSAEGWTDLLSGFVTTAAEAEKQAKQMAAAAKDPTIDLTDAYLELGVVSEEVEEKRAGAACKTAEARVKVEHDAYARMAAARAQFDEEQAHRDAEWLMMQAETRRKNAALVAELANQEADARIAAELRWDEERKRLAEEQRAEFDAFTQIQHDANLEIANNSLGLIDTVLDARIQALSQGTKREKQAARQLAMLQRATATFGIGMNTAEAVLKAFALFGPPPSPAGIASAGAAVTAGAVQAAAVLSQPLPSAFRGLDRVQAGSDGAAMFELHQNEAVIPSNVTAELGPETTRALVEGRLGGSGGGGGSVVLDGEAVGRVLARRIASGGALSRAVHGAEPVGFRSPYGG